mgnify:CR=1 FL=1
MSLAKVILGNDHSTALAITAAALLAGLVAILGPHALTLLVGLGGLLILLCYPLVALLAYLFFLYHPVISHISTLSGLVAQVSFWLHVLLYKKRVRGDVCFILLAAYAAVIIMSALLNGSLLGKSALYVLHAVYYSLFLILFINLINTKARLRLLIHFFVVIAVLQAVVGILEYFLNVELFHLAAKGDEVKIGTEFNVRSTGTLLDPNIYALYLQFTLPFPIALWITRHDWKAGKILPLFFFLILLGLILGYTRSTFISLMIIAAVLLLNNIRTRYTLFIVLGSAIIVSILLAVSPAIMDRLKSIGELSDVKLSDESSSLAVRFRQYQGFFYLVQQQPVLGIGAGNFYIKSYHYNPRAREGEEVNNMFMHVVTDAGLLGLAIYLAILATTWRNLLLSQKIAAALGDAEMVIYIRALKYALGLTLIAVQAMSGYFLFPLVLSISLSVAIKYILLDQSAAGATGLELISKPPFGPGLNAS